MAEVIQDLSDWFWNEKVWLPVNVTWADFEKDETVHIPQVAELLYALPIALGLFLLRKVFEIFVATPIGHRFNLKDVPNRPPIRNTVLEKAFYENGKVLPQYDTIVGLSKQADMSPRQVERWWRRMRVHGKPSSLEKFKQTSWRFIFYLIISWYGLYILWDKPYFWDTKQSFYNFPRHHVEPEVWWYYMIELGFYWSLVLSLYHDNRRKDFKEVLIHHVATIWLVSFSWALNIVRLGSLVLCVHDASDYWLELAKLLNYLRFPKLCDIVFIIFATVFFITRFLIYPFMLLRSSLFECAAIIGTPPSYYFVNGFLLILQALHVFWFHTICRVAYLYIVTGQVQKDERSETEPDEEYEEDISSKPELNGFAREH